MSEEQEVPVGQAIIDLREVTLRIPGECFFCEVIELGSKEKNEDQEATESDILAEVNRVKDRISEPGFSPYPVEQLAWGYHRIENDDRIFVFATPMSRLKQLGWQNLEIFRRVFPSFVSIFALEFEEDTSLFLLAEETLSFAFLKANTSFPEFIHSLPVDPSSEESIEEAKGKLLNFAHSSYSFPINEKFLIAGKIAKNSESSFEFIHASSMPDSESEDGEIKVHLSAEVLWRHDLRSPDFKFSEKKRRTGIRSCWKSLKISTLVALLLASLFIGIRISASQVEKMGHEAAVMSRQVPLVVKARELLHKLKQQKLGGIDPFRSIGRLAAHRGGTLDAPHIWFSQASFDSRNDIRLEGQGRNVEAINTFIGKLEASNVAKIKISRAGDEMRKIKSAGGETTFELELKMTEEEDVPTGG